jgi:hypothetical protein
MGFFLLMYEAGTYHEMLETTRENIKEAELYPQYNGEDKTIVSGAELIASLFGQPEYDISIDGRMIRKTEHTIDRIPTYNINQDKYQKTYRYDENGSIIMIVYSEIGS